MIEAVLFDLFETLVTESDGPVTRAGSLAGRLGLDPDAYRAEWRRRRPDVVLGRSSFRRALTDAATALGRPVADATLEAVRAERLHEKAAVLRSVPPVVLETLQGLRSRGVKLGVISNCFAEDVAGWPASPLQPLLHDAVFSFAVGLAKPDRRIYRLACRNLGVRPARALFVGDGSDDELAGARQAGLGALRALWFRESPLSVEPAEGRPGLHSIRDVLEALAVDEGRAGASG